MDFGFSPEQDELRATVRQFLTKHSAALHSRAPGRLDRPLWTRMTRELGLTALAIDERHGGFGATLVEVAIAVEESGRVLLPLPYLSTVATAAVLSRADTEAGTTTGTASTGTASTGAASTGAASTGTVSALAGIADGATLASLAIAEPGVGWDLDRLTTTARAGDGGYLLDGVKEHVLDGDVADLFVVVAVCDGVPALFAVSADDLRRDSLTTVDQTRPVARLTLASAPATMLNPPGDGGAAARYALDILHTLLAVETIGVATASLDLTASYLNVREQFGVRLATFQALRHRIADLVVCVEAATSTAWYAARTAALDAAVPSERPPPVAPRPESSEQVPPWPGSSGELPVVAPMAKLVAAEAAYAVTADSIQLHGGIGFTWEHPAHRYFKRATVTRLTHGDPTTLRRLIAARAHL